jgi:hypothetical protein
MQLVEVYELGAVSQIGFPLPKTLYEVKAQPNALRKRTMGSISRLVTIILASTSSSTAKVEGRKTSFRLQSCPKVGHFSLLFGYRHSSILVKQYRSAQL